MKRIQLSKSHEPKRNARRVDGGVGGVREGWNKQARADITSQVIHIPGVWVLRNYGPGML
jgi:hypothetical protein